MIELFYWANLNDNWFWKKLNNICIHVSVIISSKTDEGVGVIIFSFELFFGRFSCTTLINNNVWG